MDNARIARDFIAAVESGATGEKLAAFLAAEVDQHELPNRLFAQGARRNRADVLASAEKGQKVLRSQKYDVLNVLTTNNNVAIEMKWRGELAIPLGNLQPGDVLTGQFAFFLEIDAEGKITKMRNYDCYDPF
jgi:hypothetical protein